jgi:CRP-like cAMP-binding protein
MGSGWGVSSADRLAKDLTLISLPGPGELRNLPLASLPPEDLSLLAPHLTEVEFTQGQILAEIDDRISHVYFPQAGIISFVMVTSAGQSVEAATIGREGIVSAVSVLGTGISIVQSMVQIPGSGFRMDAARFQAAVEQSRNIRRMVDLCAEGLTGQSLQSNACMAFHTVEARMARWLLTARNQIDSDTIPLTQEFLGQMLGCQRTTVTLVAHTLQAAGMVRYRRGKVQILDAAALQETSCECYAQTLQRFERIFPSPD